MMGTRSFPAADLRSAKGEFRSPNAALRAGAVLVAGQRLQPQPMLSLLLDVGPEELNTSGYSPTPDLIARRLRRFIRRGHDALRPSEKQIAGQAERHATKVTLTGSLGSRLSGARLVELGPAGLRVAIARPA